MSIRPRRAAIATSVLSVLLVAAISGGAEASTPAPSNDNIGHAITLTPLNHDANVRETLDTFDPTSATLQSGEPQPSGSGCAAVSHTAWYSFTATSAQLVRFEAEPDGAQPLDVEVAVYTGPVGTIPTTQVGCGRATSDADGTVIAHVDVSTTTNTIYWIQVGTASSALGPIDVLAYYDAPPANDNIANAQPLTQSNLSSLTVLDFNSQYPSQGAYGDSSLATIEPNEPQPTSGACLAFKRTRWFTYTASVNPQVPQLFDAMPLGRTTTQLAVWSGASAPTTFVGCVTADSNNTVRFAPADGTKYWFQLGSTATSGWSEAIGLYKIHTEPTNDFYDAAVAPSIPSMRTVNGTVLPFDDTMGTVTGGTTGTEPQPSGCGTITHSVWYEFQPDEENYLSVGTYATYAGTDPRKGNDVVAIWAGQGGRPTTLLACNSYSGSDDVGGVSEDNGAFVGARLNPATTSPIFIEVGGTGDQGATGELFLHLQYLVPYLQQTSSHGIVTFTINTGAPSLHGKTVYFYRRSGLSKTVVPYGIATLNGGGEGTRMIKAAAGQVISVYAKVIATNMVNQYTNTIAFKVK